MRLFCYLLMLFLVQDHYVLRPFSHPEHAPIIQQINITKDSLLLRSQDTIRRVEVYGKILELTKRNWVNEHEFTLPLNQLQSGRNTIALKLHTGMIITLSIENYDN